MKPTITPGVLAALLSITLTGCVDAALDEDSLGQEELAIATRRAGSPLAVGAAHTCAALTDGTVRCWGSNHWESSAGFEYGKLGDGTTTWRTATPVTVVGVSDATSVSAGDDYTCALRSDGRVQCWGRNGVGQLGDGTTTTRLTAVFANVDNVVAIATAGATTCAVRADTYVTCWGGNASGAVGSGAASGAVLTPTYVRRGGGFYLAGATQIVAGSQHFCVRDSNGGASCWGANGRAQLGDRTTTQRPYAVAVVGVSNAVDITAGVQHTCALVGEATAVGRGVWCWGDNLYGQLAHVYPYGVTPSSIELAPVRATFPTNRPISDIDAGYYATCAIDQTGAPVRVGQHALGLSVLPGRATAIACGTFHGCVMDDDGKVACWGHNDEMQLGRPSPLNFYEQPWAWVAGLGDARGPSGITAGYSHTCAQIGGVAKCWGSNSYGQLGDGTTTGWRAPRTVSGGMTPKAYAVGAQFSCNLDGNGDVWCWGYNSEGELGNGSTGSSPLPVKVLGRARDLAAGGGHACAIAEGSSGDEVWCWGYNYNGQLGDGSTTTRLTPVRLAASIFPSRPQQLTAGYAHTCALLMDRTVWCWGNNGSGQVGDGTNANRTTPVRVANLASIAQIDAGAFHTCATSAASGYAFCWGSNYYGQLGDGTTTDRWTATWIAFSPRFVSLSGGGSHTCGVTSDGAAYCWGYNGYGGLGNGTANNASSPTRVSGLSSVVAVDAGWYHSCAVTGSGAVRCWGGNWSGQLGDGTTATGYAPVTVLPGS